MEGTECYRPPIRGHGRIKTAFGAWHRDLYQLVQSTNHEGVLISRPAWKV